MNRGRKRAQQMSPEPAWYGSKPMPPVSRREFKAGLWAAGTHEAACHLMHASASTHVLAAAYIVARDMQRMGRDWAPSVRPISMVLFSQRLHYASRRCRCEWG